MKLLVTGGYGNLGSWIVRDALARGWDVSVLARRHRPLFEEPRVPWIPCDLGDPASVTSALAGTSFDAVVHCGCASHSPDPAYGELALRVNTLGTRQLVEHFRSAGTGVFVYFSTMHVYGRGGGVITEDTPCTPRNDYAATHLFAEHYVRWLEAKGVRTVILRLTNSYGCPVDLETTQWSLLLNDLARMAVQRREVRLQSNGLAWRDFLWMGDVCEAVAKLVDPACPVAGTYLLGAGRAMRLRDLAERVVAAFRAFPGGGEIPLILNQADTSPAPEELRVDTSRLQQALGYPVRDRLTEEALEIFRRVSA
jgi:UDP-glucose 4-epimerase